VAPAYALTATIGILVAEAGSKMPVVIIAGFLPMFFAAYAYRELNKVAPDCGTSFTWTTKAFGPYIGWLGGGRPCWRPSSCCPTSPASRCSSSISSSVI
jgi:amino acid transporter